MKKYIVIALLLVLGTAYPAYARWSVGTAGGGAAAAPAGYSDAFTGGESLLADHDANWTASQAGITNLAINGSGSALLTGTYRSGSAYYSASTADMSIAVVGAGASDANVRPAACVRMSGSVNGYCLALMDISSGNWTDVAIYKNTGILCYLDGGSWATNTTHTLKITASGTGTVTIHGYVDGTEVTGSCSDASSAYDSGSPGIYIYGGSAGDYTNNKLDSWADYE